MPSESKKELAEAFENGEIKWVCENYFLFNRRRLDQLRAKKAVAIARTTSVAIGMAAETSDSGV